MREDSSEGERWREYIAGEKIEKEVRGKKDKKKVSSELGPNYKVTSVLSGLSIKVFTYELSKL